MNTSKHGPNVKIGILFNGGYIGATNSGSSQKALFAV